MVTAVRNFDSPQVHLVKGEQCSVEYNALNPNNEVTSASSTPPTVSSTDGSWVQLPTLLIDGLTLCQSIAIIDYLDATRDHTSRLYPADPALRAKVLSLSSMVRRTKCCSARSQYRYGTGASPSAVVGRCGRGEGLLIETCVGLARW